MVVATTLTPWLLSGEKVRIAEALLVTRSRRKLGLHVGDVCVYMYPSKSVCVYPDIHVSRVYITVCMYLEIQ